MAYLALTYAVLFGLKSLNLAGTVTIGGDGADLLQHTMQDNIMSNNSFGHSNKSIMIFECQNASNCKQLYRWGDNPSNF